MNNLWTQGYFTDLEYVDGYIAEMSPMLLNLNLALAGIHCGNAHAVAPLRDLCYLELGFGRGSSLNIHAASNNGSFYGNDFNPDHTLGAKVFAKASGADLYLSDLSFVDFIHELEIRGASFNIIVLHGVWSWVSIANQRIILDIIHRFLRVGGIVYVSYNTFPGWAGKHQLRELLFYYYQSISGSAERKIVTAVLFLEELLRKNPSYCTQESLVFLEELKTKDIAYIAHEYLNRDWNCCYFHQMARDMAEIKCDFACSGRILDHLDVDMMPLNLDSAWHIEDAIFREQLRDYCVNRQFRLDLFVRGKRKMSLQEGIYKLSNSSFVLTKTPKSFKHTPSKTMNIFDVFIKNILEFLRADLFRPKNGHEIMENCQVSFRDFITCLVVIIHQNLAMPCYPSTESQKRRTQAFNAFLFDQQTRARSSIYAASPLTGGGVVVSEAEQVFIIAMLQGRESFSEILHFATPIFALQERFVVYDDKRATNEEENLLYLKRSLREFLDEKQHLFRALEIF
ncbi:MAG: class I SAM-dependent methyltransferase [Helicobacter sp.]|nr:class I SAM-dependent methyltransferase [Helicobacter sp.]